MRPAAGIASTQGPPFGAGYSLIELAVVLALVAIMASVALPRLANSAASSRVQAAAESAAGVVRTARQTAIATSTTVRVTFHANEVAIEVIDPTTDSATDISDILASRPLAEKVLSIGTGSVSVSAPQDTREKARARRAALVAVQELTGAVTVESASGTASRCALPWGATIVSPVFGGDASIVFNGHGVPDSGGSATIRLGSSQRQLLVYSPTGEVEVTP